MRVLLALLLLMSSVAHAEVEAMPPALDLQSVARDGELTLMNRGAATLELTVSAQDVDVRPSGAQLLSPSNDIVALPATVTLAPGETRTIKIGVLAAPLAPTSYRVVVSEARTSGTYLEIPVVVQPRSSFVMSSAIARRGMSITAVKPVAVSTKN